MVRCGILALQGDFEAHRRAVEEAGGTAVLVRRAGDLDRCEGLVIPGGESTTLIRLLRDLDLLDPLRALHARGTPIFGTCAGAILLARRVTEPPQFSLGFLDIEVERNAWGRQRESFETFAPFPEGGEGTGDPGNPRIPLVFIRAPRIRAMGPGVEVLVSWGEEPVLVREGGILAGTFHPEMSGDRRCHAYFLGLIGRGPGARRAETGHSTGFPRP